MARPDLRRARLRGKPPATGYCLRGSQPGDRVAFQLPGWCAYLIYLACLKTCGRGSLSRYFRPARSRAGLGAEQMSG